MQHFTAEDLQHAVREAGTILVTFSADWCFPAKGLAASLEQFERASGSGLTVAVLKIDEHSDVPGRFGVRGLPTTMLFKDGAVAATRLGDLTERQLQDWLDELV